MKNFKINEFRCRCGCEMPADVKQNIEALVDNVLDPLRDRFGKPIYVNSGFRCKKHNRAVGGVPDSQHPKGEAADITAGSPEQNTVLAKIIIENLPYDQLILERRDRNGNPQWLHISFVQEISPLRLAASVEMTGKSPKNRKEVLFR